MKFKIIRDGGRAVRRRLLNTVTWVPSHDVPCGICCEESGAVTGYPYKGRFTHSMPCPCRAHAFPLPRRTAKGLECVFPIWFTQCGRVWFTLTMSRPCHALTMPFFLRPQHNTDVERRSCCAVVLRRPTWSEHSMASVNQTWPHCVNQMGKTHSKPLAAGRGRGMAWARHAMRESVLKLRFSPTSSHPTNLSSI